MPPEKTKKYPLLDTIDAPSSLRHLDCPDLQDLAAELRGLILASVAKTGGHLASNLGAIELTVALHRVFDSPTDKLVWDVGHQCYAHKILTGRRHAMGSLRKIGGLAGFPSREESDHDIFGAGHAGTAVSASVGIAMALKGTRARAVAIVGDGALSCGMTFEGLNHAGTFRDLPLTIVVNDNGMSISPAVGGLHDHFTALYSEWRSSRLLPVNGRDEVEQPTIFELLGLEYLGPIDGHDVAELIDVLERARQSAGPVVVHVRTVKGKGYVRAEEDPVAYHGPTAFEIDAGVQRASSQLTYSKVFGSWLLDAAEHDSRIYGITPAMREGSSLVEFAREFPDRYVDAAIAEQHAVTLAGGLAAAGQRPVVAIYSTFLQRGYDQVIHDVALQNLPVIFALDRAGIAGGDGATHLGAFDIASLRCIPNMTIMTPSDGHECYRMLSTALTLPGPSAVRYPRAACAPNGLIRCDVPLRIGRGSLCRTSGRRGGSRVAILAFGPLLSVAIDVGDAIDATVANMRFVRPLDEALVLELAEYHDVLVTLEEATIVGGAGSACSEVLASHGCAARLLRLGLPDEFVGHGDRNELLAKYGLDAAGIRQSIRVFSAARNAVSPSSVGT